MNQDIKSLKSCEWNLLQGGVAHRSLAHNDIGDRAEEVPVRGSDHGSLTLMQRLESIVEPGACSGR
jgi:hypothetical protein